MTQSSNDRFVRFHLFASFASTASITSQFSFSFKKKSAIENYKQIVINFVTLLIVAVFERDI